MSYLFIGGEQTWLSVGLENLVEHLAEPLDARELRRHPLMSRMERQEPSIAPPA
jgi:hypothetical protein